MKESLMQVQLDEEEIDTLNAIICVLLYGEHVAQAKYYDTETLKHIDSALQIARENYYD